MATEIGRLIATFEADISKFEAGRKQVESGMQKTASSVNQSQQQIAKGELSMAQQLKAAESLQRQRSNALIAQWKQQERAARAAASGHKTFSQSLSDLSTSVATLQGPLGGISGRLSSLSSLFAGVTGPAGAAVLAIGAVATAAIAGATAIYKLAASTAEATGKFKDLAQQTGFSVETLSTLANLAETSGGNIDTVSGALSIFQSNMIEAQDPTTEMSRLFKQLGIDTTNNEKALRQLIDVLDKETNAENRSAIARKLAGRTARELLGIAGDMKGTFDENTESMRGVNLVTTEMAEKGDELADAIRRMSQVFGHATNVIGQEFGPDVKRAVEIVTKAIIDNKDVIRDWATAFASAARGALIVADAVKTLGGAITGLGNLPIPTILRMLGSVSGATGILSGLQSLGAAPTGAGTPFTRNRPAFRTPNFSPFRPDALGRPPRGGGGGGGGAARTDPGVRLLQQLQDEYKDLTGRTELQATWEKLLGNEFDKTGDKLKKKIYIQKASNIEMKAAIAEMEKFVELVRQLGDQGVAGFTRGRFAEDFRYDVFLKAASGIDQVTGALEKYEKVATEVFSKSGLRPDETFNFMKDAAGLVDFSGGVGKVDRAGELREQYERHRERMRDLAFNLTSILDRAIFDGFEGGLKRGFQSLTLGILDLVKNVFLKRLENALANALSGVGSGGGGKSLLASIGMAALGAIAGSFGGGASLPMSAAYNPYGILPRASGGPVSPGRTYLVGERGPELFTSQTSGKISPNAGNTIIINVPVRSAAAYSSPKSRRQLAEDISAALRGSLA